MVFRGIDTFLPPCYLDDAVARCAALQILSRHFGGSVNNNTLVLLSSLLFSLFSLVAVLLPHGFALRKKDG